MSTKAKVIINEQHSLMEEQKNILEAKYCAGGWECYLVPAKGWSLSEQREQESILASQSGDVIFASPVPFLLAALSWRHGENCSAEQGAYISMHCGVYLFHNDNREKVELPNGKIINTVAKTGWVLATPW